MDGMPPETDKGAVPNARAQVPVERRESDLGTVERMWRIGSQSFWPGTKSIGSWLARHHAATTIFILLMDSSTSVAWKNDELTIFA